MQSLPDHATVAASRDIKNAYSGSNDLQDTGLSSYATTAGCHVPKGFKLNLGHATTTSMQAKSKDINGSLAQMGRKIDLGNSHQGLPINSTTQMMLARYNAAQS